MCVDRLAWWLQGYDECKKHFLLEGFRYGFKVGCDGGGASTTPENLKSVHELQFFVDDYISKERAAGRLAGPFSNPPFKKFHCSPIGLVEKKVKGEYRMIHHLSFPRGQSVNDHIPPDKKHTRYATIEDAIALVRNVCKLAFMSKTDVKKAFRILPLHPNERHLFVFRWNDEYYVDLAVQMGCASSCQIFERFSSALEWIGRYKLGLNSVHILDDFLLVSPSREVGQVHLQSFVDMCADVGVPLAPEKTFPPDTTMVFVGFEIDTVQEMVRLPQDKLEKCRREIETLLSSQKTTLRQLQSVTGLLSFACEVVLPGRAFLRRLFDLTIGVRKPYFRVRLTRGAKEDLNVWLSFLKQYNGRCLFLEQRVFSTHELELFTDASKSGFGAVFGVDWFKGSWPDWWKQQNITFLELYPIVLAVETWGHNWQNKRLILHTDNQALVPVITNQTSKEPLVMKLVRRLVLVCLRYNLVLSAQHIAGIDNGIADALSRFQMERFRELCPRACTFPTLVPPTPAALT